MAAEEPPIRDAASVILLRRDAPTVRVLMGRRNLRAAFMPSKYVFPGGAVDPGDGNFTAGSGADPRLAERMAGCDAASIIGCARRELEEETGLVLRPGCPLLFLFRAITPPGRPRRFDARFLVADAADIRGAPDDFSRACDELSDLRWVPLDEARGLDLPFITEVVLAEAAELAGRAAGGLLPVPESVPFFDNSGPVPRFTRIA